MEKEIKEFTNMTRTQFTPTKGQRYTNRNGLEYVCLYECLSAGNVILQNVTSKWTFTAIGCGRYEDGPIDWDMSTGGYFANEE